MSRQLSESRAIPTRTVLINDTTQLPHDYCTTPGGTLFSTTPGGTAFFVCTFTTKGARLWLRFICVNHYAKWSRRCGLGCLVILSKQKQRMAPPSLLQSCAVIGWFAVQRF